MSLDKLATAAGVKFFDYQLECFALAGSMPAPLRACLYYKTGAGKSLTALVLVAEAGYRHALVITPPSTYTQWEDLGRKLGVEVTCMSHAKFRMAGTKVDRFTPVIADEFHLFGGHTGKGWKKLDGLARGLQAPLVLASATPNYNDAERVYCIQHVLDPNSVKGGFIAFLYQHCVTQQNHFSVTPDVLGFQRYADAAEYLADLPSVFYLPDDLVYTIRDVPIAEKIPPEMRRFGYNRRKGKMIASGIEAKHDRIALSLLTPSLHLCNDVLIEVDKFLNGADGPVLIYADHSTIAKAVWWSLGGQGVHARLVTGKTSRKEKARIIEEFKTGGTDILVGTASLATGTDGFDKVCDNLLIVDDTEDDSLRRQLIGRIMPRGEDTDATGKRVTRLVIQ